MSDLWKRIAVYSALAATVCLVAWLQFGARGPAETTAARPASLPAKAEADPDADPYRLQPDVRVLQATGDLHHLITGEPLEDARAEFDRGEWRIVHRGVVAGRLPAFPEYGDLERLLSGWALALGLRDSLDGPWRRAPAASGAKSRTAIAERLGRLEATAAADLADRAWSAGVRDAGLLRLAAHALALLGVQTVDEVGGADRVAARGLALVSACAALDRAAVAADLGLVADQMGYATAAWERTESLPADDPVRRFVRQEDRALEKLAGRPAATREARFLALVRLARRHELERWRRWLGRHFLDDASLALTCTSLEIGRFEMHVPAAMRVLAGVVQDLRMIGEVEEDEDLPAGLGSLDALVREFERLMGEMRPKADGVFLDAGVLRAYYRTCFYSALAILGEHLRESLSSSPDTRAFASDLGEGDEGVAGEFQRWYTNLANAKLGRPGIPALRKDLQTMPHFGAPLLLRTFLAIEEHSSYGDVGLRAAARRIAKRLDTRPRHLAAFADIVHRHVLDLERAEDLFERGVAALGPRERRLRAWWAGYRQDRDSLESLLREPGLDPREQAGILDELAAIPGADSGAVEAGFRRCIASNRESWELLDAYTRLLRARGRYEPARVALERWLDREAPDSGPFEEIFARTRLARTYADQERYERAIEVIEPMVESQQFGAMDCMVSLLEQTGRLARAETLAVFAWGRYPDSPDAQAHVIGLCWRQRKYELAARMLAKAPVPLRAHDVRSELAPRFVDCFREKPAEGIRAIDAILASGYGASDHLAQLAAALDEAGDHRMAFEVQSRMPAEGQMAIGRVDLCYRYRKRWKGGDEALAWVRPHLREMSPQDRALLGCIAYDSGDYELLWEIDDVGPRQAGIDFHWLLRAAASARMGAARDPRRAELERHYTRGGGEHYAVLGRFLLGREDAQAALASATDPRSTCEAYYYLGLRSQCEGRIREASRWYLRCVETGQFYNGEYRWAYDQLHRWAGRGVSLARLEAEARGRPRHLAGAGD